MLAFSHVTSYGCLQQKCIMIFEHELKIYIGCTLHIWLHSKLVQYMFIYRLRVWNGLYIRSRHVFTSWMLVFAVLRLLGRVKKRDNFWVQMFFKIGFSMYCAKSSYCFLIELCLSYVYMPTLLICIILLLCNLTLIDGCQKI